MKQIIELCIDIETCRIHRNLSDLPPNLLKLWQKKDRFKEATPELRYDNNAGFFSLFSKIICISVSRTDSEKIKSYVGTEQDILLQFANDLLKISNTYKIVFVGHNVIGFDLPFTLQRAIINQIAIPEIAKIASAKPWEVAAKDTMLMWKLTSNEWFSLEYICTALNIETPKGEMDGSRVAEAYFNGEIEKIKTYCESDVFAVKNVYQILKNYL